MSILSLGFTKLLSHQIVVYFEMDEYAEGAYSKHSSDVTHCCFVQKRTIKIFEKKSLFTQWKIMALFLMHFSSASSNNNNTQIV